MGRTDKHDTLCDDRKSKGDRKERKEKEKDRDKGTSRI